MREDYKPEMPEMVIVLETTADDEKAAIELQNKTTRETWLEAVKLSNLAHDGTKKRNRLHHGLIAQEVKALIDTSGVDFGGYQDHKLSGGDDVLSIGYDEFIAPLIKAIQELNTKFEAYVLTHP